MAARWLRWLIGLQASLRFLEFFLSPSGNLLVAHAFWLLECHLARWRARSKLNRPGFSRHLRAVHYGNHGGGYEQQAVYG